MWRHTNLSNLSRKKEKEWSEALHKTKQCQLYEHNQSIKVWAMWRHTNLSNLSIYKEKEWSEPLHKTKQCQPYSIGSHCLVDPLNRKFPYANIAKTTETAKQSLSMEQYVFFVSVIMGPQSIHFQEHSPENKHNLDPIHSEICT